jgi:hypothetical protein
LFAARKIKGKSATSIAQNVSTNFKDEMPSPAAPVTHQIVEKPLLIVPQDLHMPELINGAAMLGGGKKLVQ